MVCRQEALVAVVSKKQIGLTLIEVLIAMAITAIASIIAYSGLDSSIKLAESAELQADRLQKMNRVFDILAKDFRQIIPRMVRSPAGDSFEDALSYNELSFPMLTFSRNGWTNPQPERFQRSQLQRVSYNLEDGKLTRYSWQMMDRYDDSERQEFILLEDVKSFKIRVLKNDPQPVAGKIDFTKSDWIETWPPVTNNLLGEKTNSLPMALEVLIEIEGWGKVRRIFDLVGNE